MKDPSLPIQSSEAIRIGLLLLPSFNAMATMAFLDPFRAANYLTGDPTYRWDMITLKGGAISASNGLQVADTMSITQVRHAYDLVIVCSSWTPEAYRDRRLLGWLRQCARQGAVMGGIDTGAFLLAFAGLLDGRSVTVHYEHIAAFKELFPDIAISDRLYTIDGNRISCCGGSAASDLALEIIRLGPGLTMANAAARYIFHDRLRTAAEGQLPLYHEPVGYNAPRKLREAIAAMEQDLETPRSLSAIAQDVDLSQRQLERLFKVHTGITPVQYYLEIRLDRARGMVTQTDLSMLEIAVACGFSSQEYFARTYKTRFGLPPSKDRREGRIPFQFRSFPSHQRQG